MSSAKILCIYSCIECLYNEEIRLHARLVRTTKLAAMHEALNEETSKKSPRKTTDWDGHSARRQLLTIKVMSLIIYMHSPVEQVLNYLASYLTQMKGRSICNWDQDNWIHLELNIQLTATLSTKMLPAAQLAASQEFVTIRYLVTCYQ